MIGLAPAAFAGSYTASDEATFRAAITAANADPDPSATIALTANVPIAGTAAFPAFTKPVTINTGGFTLQGADIAAGTAPGTSLTFSGGTFLTSGAIRGGNAAPAGSTALGGTAIVMSSGGALTNNGTITGGKGGTSGTSGGTGGVGVAVTGGSLVNNGTIVGGMAGGTNTLSGGSGGVGVSLNNSTLQNNGTIQGGQESLTTSSLNTAISATNSTIVNFGTIGGGAGAGFGGTNVTIVNAGTLTGGTTLLGSSNVIELWGGSTTSGTIRSLTNSDTLRLGGSINGTMDASTISGLFPNPQRTFNGFDIFQKTGSSTWTLINAPAGTTITSWQLLGGTLSVSSNANLGAAAGTLTFDGGTLQVTGTSFTDLGRTIVWGANGGGLDIADASNVFTISSNIGGNTGALTKSGPGTLVLTGTNTYTGGTTVLAGTLQGNTTSLQGNILNNAAVVFDQAAIGTYRGSMSGSGALTKAGVGTLILAGTNSYGGGTTVSGGVLQGNTTSLQGNIVNNASVIFDQAGSGTYAGAMSGTGSMTLQGGGVLNIIGTNTYTGPTTVAASSLIVNGSLASTVTLNQGSLLGGTGTIGGLVANGATLAPGNSIGTMTVAGDFAQNGGTYAVETNAQGQSDRFNVGGTATINGGMVQVLAQPGIYRPTTTYTILNAAGGVTGTYAGVTSNLAFLSPSLAYDANNVFLNLAFSGFGSGASTGNEKAVANALDQSYVNATGDFETVIGALIGLSIQQGGPTLSALSGQPWADFGTMNVASNALFMNAVAQQMALARGGQGSGQRLALAQACDVATCDAASPFSVWASGLGGFGSVQGDGNASTLTYNLGGAAAGIDYRLTPTVLLGVGVGYTSGTQWVNSFQGKGWTNAVSAAAYGSFTQGRFYADLLAGYAWSNNQLQRQISVPGLQPRTASGSTGANQFLGQAELGYQMPVYAPAAASITPFARLQVMSVNQAGFSEWGAGSLSLNVQQQTTNSVRSTLGAEIAGAIGLGNQRQLDLGLRLGWLHEYAYTGRPITAAFAGAPFNGFTVYGATPQRDAAMIGFSASTAVAEARQLYLRYDGDIGSGTDNHALNIGLRLSW